VARTLVDVLREDPRWGRLLYKTCRFRAEGVVGWFRRYLRAGDCIVDIGAGSCNVAEVLAEAGFSVTPLDLRNLSFVPEIAPVIYDGRNIPFGNKSFDVALLVFMLHHTGDPEAMLVEASRVAGRLIVIEDIYRGPVHRQVTFFFDSLLNWEWRGHPHSNRSDREWKATFRRLGLSLQQARYRNSRRSLSCGLLKHAIYYLQVDAN
jgi:hypothetical protein